MARTPAQLLLSGAVDAALDSAEGAVRLLAISELAPSETLGAEARPFAQRDGFDGAAAALCLARLAAAAGDFEDASFRADDAAARFRQSDEPIFEALAHLEVAAWLLGRNGPADGSAAASRIADAARVGLAHDEGALLEPRLELCRAWSRGVSGDLQGAIASLEQQAAGAPHELARARAWSVIARLQADAGANAANERAKQQAIMAYDGALLALPTEHRVHFWREPGRVHLKAKGQAHAPHDKRALRLLDITKRLASEHDQERLLERITDAAVELAGAERAFVLLPDHEGTLVPHLIRSSVAEDDPSVAFSRSIAEAVWIDGEPLLTVDAQGDGRLSEYLSVHKLMLRSVACLPIRGRTGTVGVLYLEHRLRSGRFKLDDLEILMAFADLAAIAIGNARLISRLEEEERRTREAKAEVEAAKGEVERVLALRTDELLSARDELRAARASLRGRYEREGIVGRSDAMRRVFAMMDRVRGSSVPVVIRGESG
ncbi:MAG: GAF domain-containing protein, partial [Myxococcota bacterium]